jgi:hypothetical protein
MLIVGTSSLPVIEGCSVIATIPYVDTGLMTAVSKMMSAKHVDALFDGAMARGARAVDIITIIGACYRLGAEIIAYQIASIVTSHYTMLLKVSAQNMRGGCGRRYGIFEMRILRDCRATQRHLVGWLISTCISRSLIPLIAK